MTNVRVGHAAKDRKEKANAAVSIFTLVTRNKRSLFFKKINVQLMSLKIAE